MAHFSVEIMRSPGSVLGGNQHNEQLARLDDASALPSLNPFFIFQLPREVLFGG